MAEKEILFNWIKNGYNPISAGWRTHSGAEKKYIREQYRNIELSIADMADYLQVSRFKLVRAFSKVKNMPPMEYIIRYRLEKSCQFIRTQKYSLTEVSELAGYKNYSTFARVFKKYYDITPKKYRKKCTQQ